MARERFTLIDGRSLASVVGGRGVGQSAEMDPQLMAAMQALIKAVSSIGDNKKAAQQASQKEVMQFMMQSLKGGGKK